MLDFNHLKLLKLKSNDIKDFVFDQYAGLNASQLEDLAKSHFLTSYNSWMLPQIAAHYGRWKLVYNTNKVDSNLTAKANITTPWELGLWKVTTQLKRGSLVKSQVNPEFASYSALVPLILAGVKKYQGVKYSQWDITQETRLVDKNLCEAMFYQPEGVDGLLSKTPYYGIEYERLLQLRVQGLTVKSGKLAGSQQKPTSAWCLRGMRGTELAEVPKLVGTMICQIWVAHPSLRTEYMVLDPNDWDSMPEPLITTDVFKPINTISNSSAISSQNADFPWL